MPINAQTIQQAKDAGYSPNEIRQYIVSSDEYKTAKQAGYGDGEIFRHLGFTGGTGSTRVAENSLADDPMNMTKAERKATDAARRRWLAKEGTLGTQVRNTPVSELAKEPLRFLGEGVNYTVNAFGEGLKSAASTVQAGGEAIRSGSIDRGLQKYREKQAEFKPVEVFDVQPSATGQMLSELIGGGINKIGDITGRPDIVQPTAEGLLKAGALYGLKGPAGKMPVSSLTSLPGKAVDAALGMVTTPERAARSALKPYIGESAARQKQAAKGVQTFLADPNATPRMGKFLEKNLAEMEQIGGRQNLLIDESGKPRVSVQPIEDALTQTVNEARETPGTSDTVAKAAEQVLNDIKNHPNYADGTIPLDKVQTMKQNIWRALRNKNAFNRDANPALNDAMWTAADAMNSIINENIPQMAAENARYGELANVNKLLTRAIARSANNNIFPLRALIQVVRGDVQGIAQGAALFALDHPTFKGYIAQRLARAQKGRATQGQINSVIDKIRNRISNEQGLVGLDISNGASQLANTIGSVFDKAKEWAKNVSTDHLEALHQELTALAAEFKSTFSKPEAKGKEGVYLEKPFERLRNIETMIAAKKDSSRTLTMGEKLKASASTYKNELLNEIEDIRKNIMDTIKLKQQ